MAICQIMIKDFFGEIEDVNNWGYGKGYDDYDLEVGIDYCEGLLEGGYIKEPFHEYDLKEFLNWAKEKLSSKNLDEK